MRISDKVQTLIVRGEEKVYVNNWLRSRFVIQSFTQMATLNKLVVAKIEQGQISELTVSTINLRITFLN